MKASTKFLITAILISVLSLFIFWLPFLLKSDNFWGIDFGNKSMQTIVTNFDGINFLIVAKSLYDPHKIEIDYPSILSGRRNLYFSAHYPGFPVLIKAFDMVTTGPNALLLAIATSNALLGGALFLFFKLVTKSDKKALFLTILALFIPARMLSMRGVGSNESLFIFFILTSFVAAAKSKHWLSASLAALATLTRSPGILLFGGYMIPPMINWYKTRKIEWNKVVPYGLIPLTLLLLWFVYGLIFGDFLVYFKVGGNINLYFPPFMAFASNFDWVSGMWLEDIIYTYIFYGTGITLFFKNFGDTSETLKKVGYYGAIYLTMIAFVVHRDIARYALPIAPIVIAGFSPYLESKYFKIGLAIMIVPVFLFSWNFILNNVQPVMDWSAYL